jgi:hypothetical protein
MKSVAEVSATTTIGPSNAMTRSRCKGRVILGEGC